MPSDGERGASAFVRGYAAFMLRPAPEVPEVERVFTPEGCVVDCVRWFDAGRGEVVEAITLATD